MKLNLKWFFENLFLTFVFIVLLIIIIYFPKTPEIPKEIKVIHYGLMVGDVLLLAYLIIELFTGNMYYECKYYSLDKVEIREFENKTIVVHNNWLYSFISKKDEIAKLEKVKVKKFYDIRKQFTTWQIAIYEQLLEKGEK